MLEAQLRGIDPSNAPIMAIAATAKFRFVTNNATGFFKGGIRRNMMPYFMLDSDDAGYTFQLIMDAQPIFLKSVGGNTMPIDMPSNWAIVSGHDVSKPDFLQCTMHFNWESGDRDGFEALLARTNLHSPIINRAGKVANSDFWVNIGTGFLEENTRILGGSIEIVFNSNPLTVKTIEIPMQTIVNIPSISVLPTRFRSFILPKNAPSLISHAHRDVEGMVITFSIVALIIIMVVVYGARS